MEFLVERLFGVDGFDGDGFVSRLPVLGRNGGLSADDCGGFDVPGFDCFGRLVDDPFAWLVDSVNDGQDELPETGLPSVKRWGSN